MNTHLNPLSATCTATRQDFSPYLDGELTGAQMASVAAHLGACAGCDREFTAWRTVQNSLAELGPAAVPARLQAQLRTALAAERARGTHLSPLLRLTALWKPTLAPLAMRLTGGLVAALVLLAGLGWLFAPLSGVQANDDNLAHLIAPRYLYSEVPPQPIPTRRDVPIVVEAKVDTDGRVYDYTILEGPNDERIEVRVEQNLLASIFKPATVFGVPVRGHVVLTYTGVSVKG